MLGSQCENSSHCEAIMPEIMTQRGIVITTNFINLLSTIDCWVLSKYTNDPNARIPINIEIVIKERAVNTPPKVNNRVITAHPKNGVATCIACLPATAEPISDRPNQTVNVDTILRIW